MPTVKYPGTWVKSGAAFTLADSKPDPKNQPIQVLSGYWRLAYDCNLNGFAYRLHEDVWDWNLSLRYSDGGCQVIGGTSGSPVLDSDRVQIGITAPPDVPIHRIEVMRKIAARKSRAEKRKSE